MEEEKEGGGYSADFVEQPPDSLVCSICLHVLRQPQLLSCCGHHICKSCVDQLLQGRQPCPLCKKPRFDVMLDRGVEREVSGLKVRCRHSSRQCEWIGELKQLESHLQKSCQFVEEDCRYGCGASAQRRLLGEHERECVKRPFRCTHCSVFEATYEKVTGQHWASCASYPVACPNGCPAEIARCDVQAHRDRDCPLQLSDCEYKFAGCNFQIPRKDLATHSERNSLQHNSLLLNQVKRLSLENQTLRSELDDLRTQIPIHTPPFSFTLIDFERLRKNGLPWWSPPFYSHRRGYKLSIVVYPNGHLVAEGSHMSVYCHLMRGEHDDGLPWPFHGSVHVELLNQQEDQNHFSRVFDFGDVERRFGQERHQETTERVTTGDLVRGHGEQMFITLRNLRSPRTQNTLYIANKTRVDFRVARVDLPQ